MKIGVAAQGCSFGRALKSDEEKDFKQAADKAKSILKIDDGIHCFKVFQTSLPASDNKNLGIGKINSQEAMNYLDFMTLYTGSNTVKIYPTGQYPSEPRFPNYYCPYERFATVVGEDNINFFKLTDKAYGNLLTAGDVQKYTVNSSFVNYENELDFNNGADFKLIKKAYYNMMSYDTQEAAKIRKEFSDFKKSQETDLMDRLAIAPFVKQNDANLFKDFENCPAKQERFEKYKK